MDINTYPDSAAGLFVWANFSKVRGNSWYPLDSHEWREQWDTTTEKQCFGLPSSRVSLVFLPTLLSHYSAFFIVLLVDTNVSTGLNHLCPSHLQKNVQDYMTRTWEEWTRMRAECDPKIIFLFVSYCSLHSRQWKGSLKGFSFSVRLQLKLCLKQFLYKLLGEKAGISIVLFWILKTYR